MSDGGTGDHVAEACAEAGEAAGPRHGPQNPANNCLA